MMSAFGIANRQAWSDSPEPTSLGPEKGTGIFSFWGEKVMKHTFSDFYRQRPRAEPAPVTKGLLTVQKADEERHMVFGWASIAQQADGSVVQDYQGDIIDIEDLENAVYDYVILYRDGGEMHKRGGVAVLVESVVFTAAKMQAMGIPEGTLPYGWWIGLKVMDDDVWAKVKDGTYRMFSIEGKAVRQEIEEEGGGNE
jgi:hypothetical protein